MGTDVYGNLIRIENALANLPRDMEKTEEMIVELNRRIEQDKEELKRPFPKEAELETKSARLAALNAELNMDGKEEETQEKEVTEKRPIKDVLKEYRERANTQNQDEKGRTNEWSR